MSSINISPRFSEVNLVGFYVYVHLRASDGTPFYVGKGKGKRAWNKTVSEYRSIHWINTAKKNGVIVSIKRDNLSEKCAFALEMQTIKELLDCGAKLVNQTKGGDGPSGRQFSIETIKKMKSAQGTRLCCSNGMTFASAVAAAEWVASWRGRAGNGTILSAARGPGHVAYGMAWWVEGSPPKEIGHQLKKTKRRGRKIQTTCGLTFQRIGDALAFVKSVGHHRAQASNIWLSCNTPGRRAYGYLWFFPQTSDATFHQMAKRPKPAKSIAIVCDDGSEYDSARDAARSISDKACHKRIIKAAKSGSSAYGKFWQLKEQ